MSKALYRTANGLMVDINNLRLVNQATIAVGNMGVNSRGDRITPDGTVIETRNEVMKQRYNSQTTFIKEESQPVIRTSEATAPVVEKTLQQETTSAVEETPTVYSTGLRGALASSIAEPTLVNVADLSTPSPTKTTLKRI